MTNNNKETVLTASLTNGIYFADLIASKAVESINGVISDDVSAWHRRFGHLNARDLHKLSSMNMVNGLNVQIPKSIECFTCAVCKIHSKPYAQYGSVLTKDILELVHTDLCGPIGTSSIGGASYFITFIDDYTRYTTVYFLKKNPKRLINLNFCCDRGEADRPQN